MPRLHEPFTLPVHGKLLEEINKTIIEIKIHDLETPLMIEGEKLDKARKDHKKHSWQDVCQLLRRCYDAINEQRKDPRKY